MTDTLKWQVRGQVFEDGSKLANWRKIEESPWQWQYDTHELSFAIYEHDGQYWKLYRARWVPEGATEYEYGYGGQACRMAKVEYKSRARSSHSKRLMEAGDLEWVLRSPVSMSDHSLCDGLAMRCLSLQHDSTGARRAVAQAFLTIKDGPLLLVQDGVIAK